MIKIVRPEIVVSFGNFGCRNVASILAEENRESAILDKLANSGSPLKLMHSNSKRGIKATFKGRNILFWPLYQPAFAHVNRYPGDYKTLRRLVSL